jgi:hypothetical protein
MLGALHGPRGKSTTSYFSNQMPRTYATKPSGAVRFWRLHGCEPEYADVVAIIERRVRRAFSCIPPIVDSDTLLGDSRSFGVSRQVAITVTSPPYYGLRTYGPDQWLRNWFLGGPADVDYEQPAQLRHTREGFVDDLARVWASVADVSLPNAQLVIRFGCLPSRADSPLDIIHQSLKLSKRPWRIVVATPVPPLPNQRRQAIQFGRELGGSRREVDIVARLESDV